MNQAEEIHFFEIWGGTGKNKSKNPAFQSLYSYTVQVLQDVKRKTKKNQYNRREVGAMHNYGRVQWQNRGQMTEDSTSAVPGNKDSHKQDKL